MKKRKRETTDHHIITIFDPYQQDPNDTYDDRYHRYLEDPQTIMERNGLTYYRAMVIEKLQFHEDGLLVLLPNALFSGKIGLLIDENGNQYEYKGCEMLSGAPPEWYSKMMGAILSCPSGTVGEYFAKQPKQE